MNILLWVLQVLFGFFFLMSGYNHLALPDNLPPMMGWMYDLTATQHMISGPAEILGGLGLILPGLTKIQTRLTPLAASGLALIMVLSVGFHVPRGETQQIFTNLVIAALLAFVAYMRFKKLPLPERGE